MRTVFALGAAEKIDARAALQILAGSGITLEQAARIAVQGKRAVRRVSVETAADLFLRQKLTDGELRPATLEFYNKKLAPFVGLFGERLMDEVTRAEVRAWHGSINQSAVAKAMQVRAIKALWRWAAVQEPPLAADDVTAGLQTQSARAGEIGFLSVDDCATILAEAGDYRPTLALMLFAGLRPDEVRSASKPPLRWQHINTAERLIRVPADVAKTGRARLIEGLPPTLWAWIGEPGKPTAPVCPALSGHAVRRAKLAAGYGPKRKWPHDALRHTFATYHVAAFNNPGQTALLMGHEGNPTMLHRHYRGLATKADAVRFWALRPD